MPKRTYWTRSRAHSKRFKDDGPYLPPEIWQHIFRHLPFEDLVTARLTCHRWRDLIGNCPTLRDKFVLQFPHDSAITKINRNYKPPGTFPVANVCFKLDDYGKIGCIKSWWPQFASTVTCLEMKHCEFAVDILQHARHLKSLTLEFARFSNLAKANFQLPNLRILFLRNSNPGPLYRMITRLEELEIVSDDEEFSEIIDMFELILSAKRTLKNLTLDVPDGYLESFSHLTDLQLETVFLENHCFTDNFDAAILPFVRANPSIVDLTINNPTVLHDVLRDLKNLKRLVLSFPYPLAEDDNDPERHVLPVIPNMLFQLEHLMIDYDNDDNLPLLRIQPGCRIPRLTKLVIKRVFVKGSALLETLPHSPILHSMILESCCFDSWNQLLSIITQPKQLQCLRFSAANTLIFESETFVCPEPITSLKALEIGTLRGIPCDQQRIVFQFFPQLTEVLLSGEAVDDDLIEEMCRRLPQLERLSVHAPGMTQKAATHLRLYCTNLKYLSVNTFWNLTENDLVHFTRCMECFLYRQYRFKLRYVLISVEIKKHIDSRADELTNEED